jgi:glutamate formiminotransferase / formiminotetrahydrofolate cyclodeaminase
VAAPTPTPAGGSVAALVGALAASLGVMGARLTRRGEAEQELLHLSERLHALVQADMEAYDGVARAGKIPKDQPERAHQMEAAMHRATEAPLHIAETACAVGRAVAAYRHAAKPAVQSDLTVSLIMAVASAEAGLHTAKANVKLLKSKETSDSFQGRITEATQSLEELRGLC